jgi:hypothetical protein
MNKLSDPLPTRLSKCSEPTRILRSLFLSTNRLSTQFSNVEQRLGLITTILHKRYLRCRCCVGRRTRLGWLSLQCPGNWIPPDISTLQHVDYIVGKNFQLVLRLGGQNSQRSVLKFCSWLPIPIGCVRTKASAWSGRSVPDLCSRPRSSGGFMKVRSGQYKGCTVAVKTLRVVVTDDPDKARKACELEDLHGCRVWTVHGISP